MLYSFGSKLVAMSTKLSFVMVFAIMAVALRLWTWTALLEPFVIYLHIAVSLLMALNLYFTSAHYKVILVTMTIMASVLHPATYVIALIALYFYGNAMFLSFLTMTIMPFVVLNRAQAPLEEIQGSLILQGANPQSPDDDEVPPPLISLDQILDNMQWNEAVVTIEMLTPPPLTAEIIADALHNDLYVFDPFYSMCRVYRLTETLILFVLCTETVQDLQDRCTGLEVPFHLGSRNGFPVIGIELPYHGEVEFSDEPLGVFCYVFPHNSYYE